VALVAGLSFTSCDNGTTEDDDITFDPEPGTLVMTDIPERFEGTYTWFRANATTPDRPALYGYISRGDVGVFWGIQFYSYKLVLVSDGKVVIPLWDHTGARYTGNHTFDDLPDQTTGRIDDATYIMFLPSDTFELTPDGSRFEYLEAGYFESLTFSNGMATVSYNDCFLYSDEDGFYK